MKLAQGQYQTNFGGCNAYILLYCGGEIPFDDIVGSQYILFMEHKALSGH